MSARHHTFRGRMLHEPGRDILVDPPVVKVLIYGIEEVVGRTVQDGRGRGIGFLRIGVFGAHSENRYGRHIPQQVPPLWTLSVDSE